MIYLLNTKQDCLTLLNNSVLGLGFSSNPSGQYYQLTDIFYFKEPLPTRTTFLSLEDFEPRFDFPAIVSLSYVYGEYNSVDYFDIEVMLLKNLKTPETFSLADKFEEFLATGCIPLSTRNSPLVPSVRELFSQPPEHVLAVLETYDLEYQWVEDIDHGDLFYFLLKEETNDDNS